MPESPNYQLPFPSLTSVPNVPTDLEALAEGVDAALEASLAQGAVQAGTRVAAVNSSGEMTLTFTRPFLSPPTVVVCMGDGSSQAALVKVKAAGTTTSNCVVTLLNSSNSPLTSGTFRVNWIAFGEAQL